MRKKISNVKKPSFRKWFDGLFSSSGFAGYSPFYAFTHPHKIIEFYMDEIRYAYQRVYRGWDDRATWGIGYWMNDIIPDILKQCLDNTYGGVVGIPITFFEGDTDENYSYTKEQHDSALERMRSVYIDVISAFENMKKLEDFEYDFKNKSAEENLKDYKDEMNSTKERMKKLIDYYYELGD
jgi:hypothetical protein